MYTFLVFLFLMMGVVWETAIFYHFLGDKLAVRYRQIFLDVLTVNMCGIVLLVVFFGPGVLRLDVDMSLQRNPRSGFFLIPDKILLLGAFTVTSDALGLTGWYHWRYPRVPWTLVATSSVAMNTPILLVMIGAWMIRAILAEVFHYMRFSW